MKKIKLAFVVLVVFLVLMLGYIVVDSHNVPVSNVCTSNWCITLANYNPLYPR